MRQERGCTLSPADLTCLTPLPTVCQPYMLQPSIHVWPAGVTIYVPAHVNTHVYADEHSTHTFLAAKNCESLKVIVHTVSMN